MPTEGAHSQWCVAGPGWHGGETGYPQEKGGCPHRIRKHGHLVSMDKGCEY